MRHDITIQGKRFRLRPIRIDDAEYITWLRSQPQNSKFIHPTVNNVAKQKEWLESYFARDGDYYFAIEQKLTDNTVGLVSIYNHDEISRSAEWGRWILEKRGYASVESVKLIYTCAFEILNLTSVFCRTLVSNQQVVRFHDKCCLTERVLLKKFFEIDSTCHDAIEHQLYDFDWLRVKKALSKLCGEPKTYAPKQG